MPPFVRHEARSATGSRHVDAYANAVHAMQLRPEREVTSWTYQAAMHATTVTPAQPLWNGCQHAGWFFVSWHRLYVYYFELIVRDAVRDTGGPDDWALPYWDYGLDPDHASIPLQFRDERTREGFPNPLYVRDRAVGINTGARLPPQVTSAATALASRVFVGQTEFGGGRGGPSIFFGQAGLLELTPHNAVHGAVGGWMGRVTQAAADPIFWLHHCNIDRLWAVWQARNAGTGDRGWTDQRFSFFDVRGAQVTKTCQGAINTVTDLNYDFDPAPGPPRAALAQEQADRPDARVTPDPQLVGASEEPVQLVGASTGVVVRIDPRAQRDALGSTATEGATPTTILSIEDIVGESNPDTVYGVYLNLPPDAPAESDDLHFVGTLSFFGIERAADPQGDEHAHTMRVALDVTSTIEALKGRGLWGDGEDVLVTLRPLGLIAGDSEEARADLADLEQAEVTPVTVGRVALLQG